VFLLVPAYLGSPGPKAVKRLCVCACVRVCVIHRTGCRWTQAASGAAGWGNFGLCPESGFDCNLRTCVFAFSALTLVAGRQEEHPACDGVVTGYLSGVRCRLFAYALADSTAS